MVYYGKQFQTLRGVTGSGKMFTMVNVIEQLNRPTFIISHDKTLAAIFRRSRFSILDRFRGASKKVKIISNSIKNDVIVTADIGWGSEDWMIEIFAQMTELNFEGLFA